VRRALAGARELALDGLGEDALALGRALGAADGGTTTLDLLAQTIERETPPRLDGAPEAAVTLLFSDIEGSTRLNERLGDERWLDVLEEHNAIVRAALLAHHGREVKSAGDGFMLAFDAPGDGLACAVELQRAFARRNAGETSCPLHVRMGVHTGPAIRRGHDFFGRNVVVAARIAAQAKGDQILVSDELHALAPDVPVTAAGDLVLKGLEGTQRVHRVELP
jgi:class 3 adenylate cyclase